MKKDQYPFFSDKHLNFFRVCEEEYTARVGGERWQKHKSDKDNWPSDQQAHNYATGEVVDLHSGEIYSTVTRSFVRTLGRNDLAEVRKQVRYIEPDLRLLRKSSGTQARSIAIRLILCRHMEELGMEAKIFQHALYKRVMNTLIIVSVAGMIIVVNYRWLSHNSFWRSPYASTRRIKLS